MSINSPPSVAHRYFIIDMLVFPHMLESQQLGVGNPLAGWTVQETSAKEDRGRWLGAGNSGCGEAAWFAKLESQGWWWR
jgi:hypothetical protein